jgi:hypothetical protein
MVMRWLIQEWIAQWLGLRERLRDGTAGPDSWWMGIRERILRFMVSRYIDEGPNPGEEAREMMPMTGEDPRAVPMEQRRTFCRVKPEDHPPRKCADLQGKLRSVSAINQHKRARWRWW